MNFFKPKFWDKNQISLFSILFYPLSQIVKFLFFFKNIFIKKYHSSIPVICVGNIYLGGTGKTPVCIEIFSILKQLKMNPAFIRKKYNAFEDEAELQRSKGPFFQNKKRIVAINEAIKKNINIVILDDGFQDFSINKDLSIICFNEKQWVGNGFTIPSGPLRENLASLKRAKCVVINGNKNINIENKILKINKEIKIFYANYKIKNIDQVKNKKITAFAGIGNPDNFFGLLKSNNMKIFKEIKFPDHYHYSDKELENLIYIAEKNDSVLLTTEKDHFRINQNFKKKINYLEITTDIEDKNKFVEEIKKII